MTTRFKSFPGLLAAIAMAIPMSASAVPVVWNFSGTITNVRDTIEDDVPDFIAVDSTYDLSLSFDTDAFTGISGGPSATWIRPTAPFLFTVDFGTDCSGDPGYQACTNDNAGSTLVSAWLFNNFNNGAGSIFDGLSFAAYPDGVAPGESSPRWSFILTGPTDVFSSMPSSIPATLDPRLMTHSLQVCGSAPGVAGQPSLRDFTPCSLNDTLVVGTGGGIEVPEPGTLALFSLGLAAIGFARRRKRSS